MLRRLLKAGTFGRFVAAFVSEGSVAFSRCRAGFTLNAASLKTCAARAFSHERHEFETRLPISRGNFAEVAATCRRSCSPVCTRLTGRFAHVQNRFPGSAKKRWRHVEGSVNTTADYLRAHSEPEQLALRSSRSLLARLPCPMPSKALAPM